MSQAPEELITVGKIVGAFGIKGWVKVKSYTQPEENVLSYSPWQVFNSAGVNKQLIQQFGRELEVVAHNHRPQGLVVQLKGVDDRNQAELLVGVELAVELSKLPKLDAEDFYWHQLIGLRVTSEFDGRQIPLGEVVDILETGANDVLVVKAKHPEQGVDQRERLIPYVPEQFIKQVDLATGLLVVEWDPEF